MILNLIHRPSHSGCYLFQQEQAHRLGLKVTLALPSEYLDDEEIIESVKKDHQEYGDEIGIWINRAAAPGSKEFSWLYSSEEKRALVKYAIDTYKKRFGVYPKFVGNYVLDAELLMMIKEYCPQVSTVVAGCFEEGTKVYHGCNNSWYLFSEGMAWGAWYPSKTQSIRPAKSEEDWSGVVAVPHLSRDLVLAYEGGHNFFAGHPAHVQRGLANNGIMHNYDYNLIDQYRMQDLYNDGISYYQVHVSSGWLSGNPNVQDDDDITQAIYTQTLEYLKMLKTQNKIQDMYVSEFGEFYKKNVPINKPSLAVGKDILYGSGKQYFWYQSPDFRILFDIHQGGSIGDLRPYAGEFESHTGPMSKMREINTYPYLIQSQLRTGYKHHYEDGTRTTALISYNGETKDLCAYKTRIEKVEREKNDVLLFLEPVTLTFGDGKTITIKTVYRITEDGRIVIKRSSNNIQDDFILTEYFKGGYGFTEYPEEMKGIKLISGDSVIEYKYSGKEYSFENNEVEVTIPQITTSIKLHGENTNSSSITEGYLFSPYYTMTVSHKMTENKEEAVSWIEIRKAK